GITGILGTNGCGKTTLLRIIAGLLPADNGGMVYKSKPVDTESAAWREKIGYLPQTPGLYPQMTVGGYLDYMLLLSAWKIKSERKNRIMYVARQFNLGEFLEKPIGKMSTGIRQQVAIAQALIHDPEIVLLDEPGNNLDMESRSRLHHLLLTEYAEKIILYIGHLVEEFGSLATQILILKDANIRFSGCPGALPGLMNGKIREVKIACRAFSKIGLKADQVLRIEKTGHDFLVRFDSSRFDYPGSHPVIPSIGEAYQSYNASGS
ncbi:MAG: ATP-binding cassette domain-containing protein, partial [Calditrichales bacterium]